jgi:ferrous iron transport protein B
MVFILLASPCIAAIATIRREMGSWGWTLAALSYQTGLAYVIALLVYQIGSRI